MLVKRTVPLIKTLLSQTLAYQKHQVLTTYLEAIPPKRVYQIVNKDDNYLQRVIQNPDLLDPSKAKKYIKKRINLIDLPVLTRLVDLILSNENLSSHPDSKSLLRIVYRAVKNGAEFNKIEQLAEFVYKLAKHNIKQPQIMKAVEDSIIEQKVPILYPVIKKILWAYTHLDLGSATLYTHICKTVKVGQYELEPLQLAETSYMLSKVSDNAQGGYGLFQLTQKHIEASLPRLNFNQLVQLSFYLLAQNIGTNAFQAKLQEELYKKYPPSNQMKTKQLVTLLKSTSSYYFKFKDAALLHMLRASTVRQASSATLEHFEDMLWSWGKSGKGDQQLWQTLEKQLSKRLLFLKPRQIAFAYYSLSSYSKVNFQLTRQLQEKFLSLDLDSINEHLLIKFLLGMYKKKDFDQKIFSEISKKITTKITLLSNKQLLTFIRVLNESDIDFESKGKFEGLQQSIRDLGQKLLQRSYTLRSGEIVQLAYLWTKLEIKGKLTVRDIHKFITDLHDIPKSTFIKATFCFLMQDDYKNVLKMIEILEQLQKYGPLGYFFSPYDFPLLVYSVFQVAAKVEGNFQLSPKMLQQLQASFHQMNPIILNEFVRKGYKEAASLIQLYHKKSNR